MRLTIGIGAAVALLAGCAQPHAASAPVPAAAACQGYTIDRSWLRRGAVYQPCDVDEPATAIQRTPTGYRPVDCKDASATVLLVVDTAGIPEPRTVRAVQSTSADFARAAVNALRQWRFSPAHKDGKKVRQAVQQRLDFRCQQVPQGH